MTTAELTVFTTLLLLSTAACSVWWVFANTAAFVSDVVSLVLMAAPFVGCFWIYGDVSVTFVTLVFVSVCLWVVYKILVVHIQALLFVALFGSQVRVIVRHWMTRDEEVDDQYDNDD